jgi:tripartite-type tricarboxylate transporter receptor subunit TctC
MIPRRTWLTLPLATPALPAPARTQERALRLVIAFPPGGSTDILGRLIAPRMSDILGIQVTPENRSGASGAVGAGVVAQAAPDGSTLLLDSGGQAVNPIGNRQARTLLFFFSSSMRGSFHSGGRVLRNSPRNWVALMACQFL